MRLSELIHELPIRVPQGADLSLRICDLTEDSRTVLPGSLFVARSGLKSDGNRFAADAIRQGAAAILTDDPTLTTQHLAVPVLVAPDILLTSALLAERFYQHPSSRVPVLGVTGTNGKTTTSFLIWQLLNHSGLRCGLIGTVLIDDGREVGPATMTTPPAMELSRSIASMADAGCSALAMEISSHALDQRRADALSIGVAIFTNLTGDHLDYHKTMDAYAAAKARLFTLLPAHGRAIVAATDPWTPRITQGCTAPVWTTQVLGPGESPAADCTASILASDMDGMTLRLQGPWGDLTSRTPLIGRYNAMNVLQAVAAAHALGLDLPRLQAALAQIHAPPGRLERVSAPGDDLAVFVDYAHSDDSLRNVLQTVAAAIPGRGHLGARLCDTAGATVPTQPSPRLWAVFGCGGDRDRTKRPRMGRAAADLADAVVVTSDNPRSERPSAIIDEILAGIPDPARPRIAVQADRARAIRHAIESALPGDVVVIAGKGHETEQILPDGQGGTVRTHFDDREVARECLAARRTRTTATRPA